MAENKKIKVALVYLGRKGGGPVYSLEIAKELEKKADVFCVVSRYIDNKSDWERNIKNIYFIDTYKDKLSFFFSFFKLGNFFNLKKKIKEFSPDVIYYPFFHYWLALISLWFSKTPKVYTSHDPILHSGEKDLLTKLLQNSLIKSSKRVIILSSVFISSINKSQDKIDIIPHGVFSYYKDKMEHTEEAQHPPTLLFFGRILEYKGLDVLLRAFPLIKKEIPQARLIIAGSGGIKPYENLINNNKEIIIENRWIKDGEVAGFFLKSDILVCPYRDASQSGAIPVAYVFRVPVVASKTGGLIEQVDDNKTGILVENGDYVSLAKACSMLLKDNSARKEMGEAGHLKATTEWSWGSISDKILISLKKAINNQ